MVGDSLAAREAELADARASHKAYVGEAAFAHLRVSPEFREAELAIARNEAELLAMQTSVAAARKQHLEHEVQLALAHLGISPQISKSEYELARNAELVAMERSALKARDEHQQHERELRLAQLRISPEFLEAEESMAQSEAALLDKIVEDAHGGVQRAQAELEATERRLEATIGKVVLTGAALERDVDLVRSAVEHGTRLVEGRQQHPEDQDYARWCLDNAIHRVTTESKSSTLPYEAKESLKKSLEALHRQYAIITRAEPVSDIEYQEVLSTILKHTYNVVDAEWLRAQREVLEAREPVKTRVHTPQVDLSMTH